VGIDCRETSLQIERKKKPTRARSASNGAGEESSWDEEILHIGGRMGKVCGLASNRQPNHVLIIGNRGARRLGSASRHLPQLYEGSKLSYLAVAMDDQNLNESLTNRHDRMASLSRFNHDIQRGLSRLIAIILKTIVCLTHLSGVPILSRSIRRDH
jgi:hypothetical protein